mmetsp:Transcript_28851/g.67966  ORF Transcript_28851/g.67966 Transcript_28851/m.67966 type:complete len:268 (-) Transcript_28851:2914-3717(-)
MLLKDRRRTGSPSSLVRGTWRDVVAVTLRDGRGASSSDEVALCCGPTMLARCPVLASAIMRLKPCRDSPPESSGDIGDSEGNGEGEASGVRLTEGRRDPTFTGAAPCACKFSESCAAILSLRMDIRNLEALLPTTSASPLSVTRPAFSASLASSAAFAALRKDRTWAKRLATSLCLSSSTAAVVLPRLFDPCISCHVLLIAFTCEVFFFISALSSFTSLVSASFFSCWTSFFNAATTFPESMLFTRRILSSIDASSFSKASFSSASF